MDIAYKRYRKPILWIKTGHFGEDRAKWIRYVTDECREALLNGTDLRGICIYPVIDCPDWDELSSYSNCGLWDLNNEKERILNENYYAVVQTCMTEISNLESMHIQDNMNNNLSLSIEVTKGYQ